MKEREGLLPDSNFLPYFVVIDKVNRHTKKENFICIVILC